MVMTDGELITSFRQAKDPKAQIHVLAELNCVTDKVMHGKLHGLGLDVGDPPKAKKAPEFHFDQEVALTLVQSGMRDKDVAEQLSISMSMFRRWKKEKGLVNQGPKKYKPVMPKESQLDDARAGNGTSGLVVYSKVLSGIAEAFPEAVLAEPASGPYVEITITGVFDYRPGTLTLYVK